MLPDYSILEGEYLRDLLDQARVLSNTVGGLGELPMLEKLAGALARGDYARIVLTGMGGSFHALHPLNLRLVENGFTSLMVETSELVHCMPRLLDSRTLLVAVSQSGRSAEMVRLLDRGDRRPTLIGVTNTLDSPLAFEADVAVLTQAGPEFSVSCKTYLASLVALEWVGASLCRKDLRQTRNDLELAAPAAAQYLAHWKEHVASLCQELSGIRHLFLTGRGGSLAAAGAGGLIVKESAHFHAEGMSSPAFRHGPLEMAGKEVFVLVFSGEPATAALNEALVRDVQKAGGRAALAGTQAEREAFRLPSVPRTILPVVEMLPVQMISLALAALAGREPGRFELLSKVTTVE